MAEYTIVLDNKAIAGVLRTPAGPIYSHILKLTRDVERYATGSPTRIGPRQRRGRQSWSYTPGRIPRDTGFLKSTAKSNVVIENQEITGIVSVNAKYALFVHDGTRYLEKRPFLKDALFIVMKQG